MAIEETVYVTFAEVVFLHVRLMRLFGEPRYGVFDRTLIESALARPQQAAAYENADLIRQAATLCLGLIKNHPWVRVPHFGGDAAQVIHPDTERDICVLVFNGRDDLNGRDYSRPGGTLRIEYEVVAEGQEKTAGVVMLKLGLGGE